MFASGGAFGRREPGRPPGRSPYCDSRKKLELTANRFVLILRTACDTVNLHAVTRRLEWPASPSKGRLTGFSKASWKNARESGVGRSAEAGCSFIGGCDACASDERAQRARSEHFA